MRGIILVFLLYLSFVGKIYSTINNVPDEKYVNSCPAPTYHLWKSNEMMKDSKTENKSNKFLTYPNMKLMKGSARIATYNFSSLDVRQCIHNCSITVSCVSFNAYRTKAEDGGELLTCTLFSTHKGSFLQKHGTTFYTRYAPHCPGYCEELYYLKVCAHCDCVSLCSSNITHYCDCTSKIKIPQKNCSGAVINYGTFPLSALYYIDTTRYTLKAMCQLYRYNVVETLWVTLYRQLHVRTDEVERTGGEYHVGFNKPYDDNYFIGYDKMAALTETDVKMTLGVMFLNKFGKYLYAELDGFKMVVVDAEKHSYKITYDSWRSNDCIGGFLKSKSSQKCPRYALFGICSKRLQVGNWETNPLGVTFVLRPQKFNKPVPVSTGRIIKYQVLGEEFQGQKESCFIINFKMTEPFKTLMLLRVFFMKGGWKMKFEIYYHKSSKEFLLYHANKALIGSLPFNLKVGIKYKVRLLIQTRSDSKYDVRFGIQNVNILFKYPGLGMSGKLLMETGYKEYKPFYLESIYFNGENILK